MIDHRLPEHRRETFLDFYECHLKYKSHPGGVYQFIPYLSQHFGWDLEQRLWYATINGMTQHPMTSLAIFNQQPEPPRTTFANNRVTDWFNRNWDRLPFDTDRRYQKKEAPRAMATVGDLLNSRYGTLENLYDGDFATLWMRARNDLWSLGRLGAWSGLEFVKIAGRPDLVFDTLMLDDRDGSKSHRNGLCILLGRDDLDWHKSNPGFTGRYREAQIEWLTSEGEKLLREARHRFADQPFTHDVGYETLESTLCCYKSWHRPNRRYPSVYNDMAYARLLDTAEKNPGLDLTPFWEARKFYLPKRLRIEDNPDHPQYDKKTLDKGLQNQYRLTGVVPNMYVEEVQ